MMNPSVVANIDLGRPLLNTDIVDDVSYPIDKADSGHVYCHVCEDYHSAGDLQPLTSSTGVFTAAVRCEMDAPVWVCLEHVPYRDTQFDAFTAEVQVALRAARQAISVHA